MCCFTSCFPAVVTWLRSASHIPTTSSTSAPTSVNSTNRTYLNPPLLQYLHVFPRRLYLNVPSQRQPSRIGRLLRILRLEIGSGRCKSPPPLLVLHRFPGYYLPAKQHPSRVGRLLRAWWLRISPDWAMGMQELRSGGQAGTSEARTRIVPDGMQRTLRVILDV